LSRILVARYLVLVLSVLVVACLASPKTPSAKRAEFLEKFSFLTLSDPVRRMEIFERFSLDDQAELFMLTPLVNHPGDPYLARAVARRGSAIIPALLRQLEGESDESLQYHLLGVFREMQMCGIYAVRDDRALMSRLNETVDSMRDAERKQIGSELIAIIRETPPHSCP